MQSYRQLLNGIVATVLVVAFALLVSTSVSPQWLGAWGSLFLNAMVPAQIVISLLWGCKHPAWAASLPQPWRGLAFTALTVVVGLLIGIGEMDLIVFMTRVCVPEIFGIFIILVMPEGAPDLKLAQPWRGLVLTAIASGLSVLMFALYRAVAIARFNLPAGPPSYALELWLAPSMLGVTFPAMVTLGAYFQFWPLRASPASAGQA